MRLAQNTPHRGVAAVEFAILLMPMLMMIFGTTELGRAIYTYNTLTKTVRDAARHLSQHGPGDPAIQAEASCLAVYGNSACTGSPVAPGLSGSNVRICDANSTNSSCLSPDHSLEPTMVGGVSVGVINLVSVSIVNYSFTSVIDLVVPSMTFENITTTMRGQL